MKEVVVVNVMEIELLAGILQRTGISQIEAIWLNDLLNRLRTMCASPVGPAQDRQEVEQPEDG